MPLLDAEDSYFENIVLQRRIIIDKKYQYMEDRFGGLDQNIRFQTFARNVKEYAKESIDSRVNTLIETYKKFEKYPNAEDVRIFSEDSRPYVSNKLQRFTQFCNNPFGPVVPQTIING